MVARFRGLRTGVLDVAMVSTAKYFLPRLLALFRDEHPGVEVRLQVGNNRDEVVALMREGAVELAIMGRPPRNWPSRAEPFAMHPHGLVTSVEHPFARAESVSARALMTEGFIVREPGSGTRAALEEFMEAHQMSPRIVMQMSSNEAIKQAVMAGMGIAMISRHTVWLELGLGMVASLPVDGLPLMRSWFVVHRRNMPLLPVHIRLRDFLIEQGQSIINDFSRTHDKIGNKTETTSEGTRVP
jgi:LysR family transcriptional regulator, low CO2-responsive transcriptional regulator